MQKAVSLPKVRFLILRCAVCAVPGEIWGGAVLRYFSALEEGINLLPGFAPELQGVYIEEHDGRKQVWCYVIKPRDAQSTLLKGKIMSQANRTKWVSFS